MTVTPAAMPGAKPIPPKPVLVAESAISSLTETAGIGYPWTTGIQAANEQLAVDAAQQLVADGPLPPRPTPAPPPHTTTRTGPLYGLQFLRKEAVRLAIDSYRDTDRPSDDELLATANRLADFIRSGTTSPTRNQED